MGEATEREVVKGRLLDAWIEDLRSDREPRVLPEMQALTAAELEEVMQLARWYKASFYPSRAPVTGIDSLVAKLREKVYQDRLSDFEQVREVAANSATFEGALRAARTRLGVETRVLEQAYSLSSGLLRQLESGQVPPHRVAVEKLAALLRGLRFSHQIVELIRRSCLQWAETAYGTAQTQLGRIDPSVSDAERFKLLQDAAEGTDEGLVREVERIRDYCESLERRLA
jgi:hypothetical protein